MSHIHGRLGVRANKFDDNGLITSPSWNDFRWDKPVVWAKCDNLDIHPPDRRLDSEGHIIPGFDYEEEEERLAALQRPANYSWAINCRNWGVPNCSCGIYVTTAWSTVRLYTRRGNNPIFLVEALGITPWSIRVYADGFRSSGVQIIAIVLPKEKETRWDQQPSPEKFQPWEVNAHAAALHYNIPLPVITWEVAVHAMKEQAKKIQTYYELLEWEE